jgi:hypothetical protein
MELGVVLIVIGIACAALVSWGLGALLVVVGIVVLLLPAARRRW